MHDIKKLPKWAQKLINKLETEIHRRDSLLKAHCVLFNKDWFTIRNDIKGEKPMKLWLLDKDSPHAICSLGPNDILLIGREKNG